MNASAFRDLLKVFKIARAVGLMHDDIHLLKIHPKPPLSEIFLEPLPPSCYFHEVILCISVSWEFDFLNLKLTSPHFESEVWW